LTPEERRRGGQRSGEVRRAKRAEARRLAAERMAEMTNAALDRPSGCSSRRTDTSPPGPCARFSIECSAPAGAGNRGHRRRRLGAAGQDRAALRRSRASRPSRPDPCRRRGSSVLRSGRLRTGAKQPVCGRKHKAIRELTAELTADLAGAVRFMHRVGARHRPSPRCAHGRTRAPRPRYENRTSSTHESTRRCRSRRERKAAGLPPPARTLVEHAWQGRGPNLHGPSNR
jgi:hypothetical protein